MEEIEHSYFYIMGGSKKLSQKRALDHFKFCLYQFRQIHAKIYSTAYKHPQFQKLLYISARLFNSRVITLILPVQSNYPSFHLRSNIRSNRSHEKTFDSVELLKHKTELKWASMENKENGKSTTSFDEEAKVLRHSQALKECRFHLAKWTVSEWVGNREGWKMSCRTFTPH